jgi:hypothetical protein
MASCDCCGCVLDDDYGTSLVSGTGSSGDPFVVEMIDPGWQRPVARVRNSASQLIASSTSVYTAVTFDTEVFDIGSFWDIGNPTRLTAPLDGIYLFGGGVVWAANATGIRELGYRLNGTTILNTYDQSTDAVSGATNTPWMSSEYQWRLGVGDYVELVVRQESGGNLNITADGQNASVFWMMYAGRVV